MVMIVWYGSFLGGRNFFPNKAWVHAWLPAQSGWDDSTRSGEQSPTEALGAVSGPTSQQGVV